METTIYNQKGKEEGKVNLPESIFSLPMNNDLVHQVVVSMTSNLRSPIAHTKDRSEVRGGGKKPWRQKGTGRARHGSNRSPIWIGGGVTFGPTNEKNYSKKINKKMKLKALYVVLAQKFREGEILFIDNLEIKDAKTKEAKGVLENLSKIKGYEKILTKKNNSAYLALGENKQETRRAFSNFGNIFVNDFKNLNVLDILKYKYLVITKPEEALSFLENRSEKEIKEEQKIEKNEIKEKKELKEKVIA